MTKDRGLTLIDLLITIAIAALLLGVGLPNFHSFFAKQQADAHAHQILRQLQKTRELAVFSGNEMIMCGIDAEQKCVRDHIRRFVTFVDQNGNRKVDAEDTVESELQLNYSGEVYLRASGARFIRYFNDGTANPLGSIFLCPKNAEPTLIRRATINMSGRPYLARPRSDGIVTNADASAINCTGSVD